MKDPGDRTKVVLRHLPPGLSRSVLKEQIDSRFGGGYNWFSFRPGRSSHRHQQYSRAYIDFRSSEDVIQFAQAFDGHVFVNEKGSHFKALVEYAPSQRVPKTWSKKDGREGTILKDTEYLEFLEMLAKPVDNLPSAEIQLERKEAERAAVGAKDNLIVTPLMNYIRQKRAAKSGSQRSIASTGKLGRRGGGSSAPMSSAGTRRGLGKKRTTTATYVMKDITRTASNKDKSTFILLPRREDQRHIDIDQPVQVVSKVELAEDDAMQNIVTTTEGITTGGDGPVEAGKRKLLLLKNKEKELVNGHISEASSSNGMGVGFSPQKRQLPTIKCVPSVQTGGASNQRVATSPVGGSPRTSSKQNQRRDVSGRIMRGVVLDKDIQQSPSALHAEQQNHISYTQRDEKVAANDYAVANMTVKQDRRMRNKDRPDRPFWTPRRRSDGTVGADESQSCFRSGPTRASPDVAVAPRSQASLEEQSAFEEENNEIMMTSRIGDTKAQGSGRNNVVGENGNHRQVLRRPPAPGVKEYDISSNLSDTKSPKRGGILGHGSHEKQVWVAVQKSA